MSRAKVLAWAGAALALLLVVLVSRRQHIPTPSPAGPPLPVPAEPFPPAGPAVDRDPTPAASVMPPPAQDARLARLAGPGYEAAHPGVLARLEALLQDHPGDPEWLAGAVAFLGRDQDAEKSLSHWLAAADLFPDNPLVADKATRVALAAWLDDRAQYGQLDAVLSRFQERFPRDPKARWLRASLAMEEGRWADADVLLAAAESCPASGDVSGLAERGGLAVAEAMGEPGTALDRYEILVRFPRPELNAYSQMARALEESQDEKAPRLMPRLEIMARRMGESQRTLVGFLEAHDIQASLMARMLDKAEREADLTGKDAIESRRQALDAERAAFWGWSKEYRAKASERLRPVFDRLGVPFHPASALFAVPGMKAREAELTAEEARLLEEAGHALFNEMDAYRRASPK